MWTKAYNRSRFANAEQRLFGEGNYELCIWTFQGISGFHQIRSTNSKGLKDFLQDKQSLDSNYNPQIYLLRGQGFLWYTALTRAHIHTKMLYIGSKIDYQVIPGNCQSCTNIWLQLPHNDDNILFTYGAYYKLLSNVTREVRVSPTPSKLAI